MIIAITKTANGRLLTDTGEQEMNVDASAAPLYYMKDIEEGKGDFVLIDITFGIEGGKLDDPAFFSGLGVPLVNGIDIVLRKRGTDEYLSVSPTIRTNRDINIYIPDSNVVNYETKTHDVIRAVFADNIDYSVSASMFSQIGFRINDDLSGLIWMRSFLRGFYKN